MNRHDWLVSSFYKSNSTALKSKIRCSSLSYAIPAKLAREQALKISQKILEFTNKESYKMSLKIAVFIYIFVECARGATVSVCSV